jgi:hypothetical protein
MASTHAGQVPSLFWESDLGVERAGERVAEDMTILLLMEHEEREVTVDWDTPCMAYYVPRPLTPAMFMRGLLSFDAPVIAYDTYAWSGQVTRDERALPVYTLNGEWPADPPAFWWLRV